MNIQRSDKPVSSSVDARTQRNDTQCNKRYKTSVSQKQFDEFTKEFTLNEERHEPSGREDEMDVDMDRVDKRKRDTEDREFFVHKTAPLTNCLTTSDKNNQDDRVIEVSDHVNTGGSPRETTVGLLPSALEKEIYVVRDDKLCKCRNNPEIQRFTRFDDKHSGKANISIKLVPEHFTTRKGMNKIKIWMLLSDLQICPISVEMLNHFTAEAEFEKAVDANRALDLIDSMHVLKIKAYVEQRSIVCKGVVSDWPAEIPELWDAMQNKSDVIKIERMYRRKWDAATQKSTLVASSNITITFKLDKVKDLKIFHNEVNLRCETDRQGGNSNSSKALGQQD
ncbi:uncharacterized protein LOC143896083 isoform X1 [Temnothorax americanus]|uniref:uncharacterized protein LOC143896083 isoform X1 n=1 Tax=Temnothorax americanus TaxID=1964332 RepID=UPI0040687B89